MNSQATERGYWDGVPLKAAYQLIPAPTPGSSWDCQNGSMKTH